MPSTTNRWLLLACAAVCSIAAAAAEDAQAQTTQEVCIQSAPPRVRAAVEAEIVARGLTLACGGADSWTIEVDVPDPLGVVWITARRGDAPARQARVDGPLDTLDERALAIAAASLLDEAPTPLPLGPRGVVGTASETPQTTHTSQTTLSADGAVAQPDVVNGDAPRTANTSPRRNIARLRDTRSVASSRDLRRGVMLSIAPALGFASREQTLIGGEISIAIHLAPWFRLRSSFLAMAWPNAFFEDGGAFSLEVVLPIVRAESWVEFGVAAHVHPLWDGHALRGYAGPELHTALFYALGESWRLFVRLEGALLAPFDRTNDARYFFALTPGLAVYL